MLKIVVKSELPVQVRRYLLTNRGVFIPWFTPTASFAQYLVIVLIALAAAVLVGYIFITMVYWVFSYSMSYGSRRLETSLGVGER